MKVPKSALLHCINMHVHLIQGKFIWVNVGIKNLNKRVLKISAFLFILPPGPAAERGSSVFCHFSKLQYLNRLLSPYILAPD